MKELVSNLITVLKNEFEYYQKLKDLAEIKNQAIIDNDVDELSQQIEKDKKVIETLDNLEEKRVDVLVALREELGLEEGQLEYEVLIENISDRAGEELNRVREKLLQVMEELHQINEQNKVLLQEAIKLNNFSFNMIANIVEPDLDTYTDNNKSNKNKSDSKIKRIIDRRA
ncbi:MAG: flagellar protein FlgN [bacterium]